MIGRIYAEAQVSRNVADAGLVGMTCGIYALAQVSCHWAHLPEVAA